jgi:ABC-2 type transport system permease protein/oleandomycin transport system permease protein
VTGLSYAVSDTMIAAWRNLLRIRRQPDLLVSFTIQPIMFLLLFAYVFGGAIETPGYADYKDFLLPGIIAQSMTFGGFVTAIGLTDDLRKGLIDRFRSLPMARSAVLAGRTLADVVTNAFQLFLMLGVGLLIGFDFNATPFMVIGGILLMLLFGYAFSWVFALIGLRAASPESANAVGFTAIFPLTFASSAFAPPESMPDWLQAFAENNPFSTIVDALRHLWLGAPAGNDVWGAVAWSLGLIAVFSFLSVNGYRKAVAK